MIHHLSRIADHLSTVPTFDEAIEGIAMFVCVSGRPSRIYLAKIERDLQISHLADVGFEAGFSGHQSYGEMVANQLMIGHPSHHSLVFMEHDHDYQLRFKATFGVSDQESWKCTILMAISPLHVASLSLHTITPEDVDTVNYFNAIRSMLLLFLKSQREPVTRGSNRRTAIAPEGPERKMNMTALTERQKLILRMIELGDTNSTIAERMGYSESLIRQETITIYRKLGITGRKDLNTGR